MNYFQHSIYKLTNSYKNIVLFELFCLFRYRSHVVSCSSCNVAYKGFKTLHISLQVFSITSVAIMAATKHGMISTVARNTLAAVAILCFLGSKWLSHFIYKNFHFHDYNHAF
ncbi:hypothetical protein Hanom_Chr14g01269011 [Helianthus anomalus]